MTEPVQRPVTKQRPAWIGHPFFLGVFGVIVVVGVSNIVFAIVSFTTWFRITWSLACVALFVWIFLLTFGVWRRERRGRLE